MYVKILADEIHQERRILMNLLLSGSVINMNIMFFLTPKSEVSYVFDHSTVRQAIERIRTHGFSAIPVIDKEGRYIGTITEGDFLRYLLDRDSSLKSMELEVVKSVPRKNAFDAVTINTDIEDLIKVSMRQNFVPVVDDDNVFIGIVTRKDIISFCYVKLQILVCANKDASDTSFTKGR